MRVAFTHNIQVDDSWKQAEFDSPATVLAITRALENLGHRVEAINVSGPMEQTIQSLESIRPDLVFKSAEGDFGKFREALFPAIFEQLKLPFTGSDAHVCTVTMDKNLTKLLARSHGVPTPASIFLTTAAGLSKCDLSFPVVVKPNFGGSSIGYTAVSGYETSDELTSEFHDWMSRFS